MLKSTFLTTCDTFKIPFKNKPALNTLTLTT